MALLVVLAVGFWLGLAYLSGYRGR